MKTSMRNWAGAAVIAMALGGAAQQAQAGPFIIAGTDADDHGSVSGGANQDGWFFMQRALENLAPGVTNGNKTVVFLGSDPGTQAGLAAQSAFSLSSLPGAGWSANFVNGAANIDSFMLGGLASTGIVMLDSGDSNVTGGITSSEEASVTARAGQLNNFLGAGGGLFTQANGLGFLGVLLPGLTQLAFQDQGLALTAAGQAAFPGLNNGDLSAGPYHKVFTTTAGLPILAVETNNFGRAVIIGASGGSITNPNPTPVPEPASMALMLTGLVGLGVLSRRRRRA